MAFTVEDGTGVAGANSYVTLAYADTYFADRAVTDWVASDGKKQSALIKATDYIETRWSKRFKGNRQFDTQELSFPRYRLYDSEGKLVEGIPTALKKATCEYALRALSADLLPDPVLTDNGQQIAVKREKIGPIEEETQYQVGGSPAVLRPYPAADRLLQDYVTAGGVAIR